MTNHVATYPSDTQLARWKQEADERDMSLSSWVACMVEAGQKKFAIEVTPDETNRDLRHQRNDLRRELERSRERIEELEQQLYRGERRAIIDFVEQNPGVEEPAIQQHVIETASQRTTNQLEVLQGRKLRKRDGKFHPIEGE